MYINKKTRSKGCIHSVEYPEVESNFTLLSKIWIKNIASVVGTSLNWFKGVPYFRLTYKIKVFYEKEN